MATAVADTYSAPSGATLYAGRSAPTNPLAVLIGDSLTAVSYGEIHPYYWTNGWLGAPL